MMTLGELIRDLENIDEPEKKNVYFDFGHFRPDEFHSWRGDYSVLSLDYESGGEITVLELISRCKKCIGQYFTGWKGGDYQMGEYSDVWIAQAGQSGNTVIKNVRDTGYDVILETQYEEY